LISVQFEALGKGLMPLYEPAEAFIGGHRVPCVSTVAQPGPGPARNPTYSDARGMGETLPIRLQRYYR